MQVPDYAICPLQHTGHVPTPHDLYVPRTSASVCHCPARWHPDVLLWPWQTSWTHLHFLILPQEEWVVYQAGKCVFDLTSVEFLGDHISLNGIQMDLKKVEVCYPRRPNWNGEDIHHFMGFTIYFSLQKSGYVSKHYCRCPFGGC